MADPFTDAPLPSQAGAQQDFTTFNDPAFSTMDTIVDAPDANAFATNAPAPASKPLPQIDGLSESTQALLKRVGQSHNFSTGSPEWEKAREEVMKRMSSTTNSNFPPIIPKRGGISSNGSAHTAANQDATFVTPKRGRGRPPGRPRGSGRGGRPGRPRGSRGSSRGRGGKRKRDDDDNDEDDGSDVCLLTLRLCTLRLCTNLHSPDWLRCLSLVYAASNSHKVRPERTKTHTIRPSCSRDVSHNRHQAQKTISSQECRDYTAMCKMLARSQPSKQHGRFLRRL